jgi:hypothetical protein
LCFSTLTTFGSTAITGWLFSGQPAENNGGGAAYISVNFNSDYRAVFGAGPALHAAVFIDNYRFAVFNAEYIMRAHLCTLSATDTFFR